jgi:hypothetical protein
MESDELMNDLIGSVDKPIDIREAGRLRAEQAQRGKEFLARLDAAEADPGDAAILEAYAWNIPVEASRSRSEAFDGDERLGKRAGSADFERIVAKAAAAGDFVSPPVAIAIRLAKSGAPRTATMRALTELASRAAENLDSASRDLLDKAVECCDLEAIVKLIALAFAPDLLAA